MALRYLLDTNILSDLVRDPQGRIAQHITRVGEDRVCTSVVVAAELRFGARNSGSQRLAQRIDLILSALDVLPLEPPADRHYGEIRQLLESQGMPVGPNDLLIAAHARALDLSVVTANAAEFARIPALRVENWLAP